MNKLKEELKQRIRKCENRGYAIALQEAGYIKEYLAFVEKVEGYINILIANRNNEQKNNNIYRKSNDELNNDFIEDLEDLKERIFNE